MKTFYVMQGGALEEYLNESQSNSNGRGNYGSNDFSGNCDKICANAGENSQARIKCGCDDQPPAASIDTFVIIGLLIGFILIIKKFRNNGKTMEKNKN